MITFTNIIGNCGLAIAIIFFLNLNPAHSQSWTLETSSSIKISGDSNVAPYQCSLNSLSSTQMLSCIDEGGVLDFDGSEIQILINQFKCDNEMMTEDFRDLLKHDEYPQIRIALYEVGYGSGSNCANINLNIAGVEKRKIIDLSSLKTNDRLELRGSIKESMKNFEIEPPSKFFGLIQVEEHITIEFAFNFIMQ